MTEKFDSKFHKQYVGGDGPVEDKETILISPNVLRGKTATEVLEEYRWYMRDPDAVLPEEVEKQLQLLGVI